MEKILITPRSMTRNPPEELDILRQAGYELVFATAGKMPDEKELLDLVQGCVGWIAGIEPINEKVLNQASKLRAISRNGVGVDNIALQTAKDKGVSILRAMNANSIGVAELTVSLMLTSLRRIAATDKAVKSGSWLRLTGYEIYNSTVGIIGFGAIGRHVGNILLAMGAKILVYDPFLQQENLPDNVILCNQLTDLLANANIVTLHAPARDDHQPLIGQDEIAHMKKGSVLVNCARHSLIDQEALIEALESGHIDHYATDVFEQEPPKDLRLAGHERVIATSHIGGLTVESIQRATRIAIDNLLQELRG